MPGTKSNNRYAPTPEPSVKGITLHPSKREKEWKSYTTKFA